jgi:hypothetical protein
MMVRLLRGIAFNIISVRWFFPSPYLSCRTALVEFASSTRISIRHRPHSTAFGDVWDTQRPLLNDTAARQMSEHYPELEMLCLAIPRRIYTNMQILYVAKSIIERYRYRDRIQGLTLTYEAAVLRHFTAPSRHNVR